MNQQKLGVTLLCVAGLMVVSNIADALQDLQTWHGIGQVITPALIAPVLKQLAGAGLAALGGKMLNPFGGGQ